MPLRKTFIIAGIVIVLLVAGLILWRMPDTARTVDDQDFLWYERERQRLEALVRERDPSAAFTALRSSMERDQRVFRFCHALAHEVGRAALEKLGFQRAQEYEDDLCGSGYLHGVVETHFSSLAEIETEMHELCGATEGKCFHGVGHGLMYYTDNDLPRAVSLCDSYGPDSQKIQCAEGVFMEHFTSDDQAHPPTDLDPEDPFVSCRDQSRMYKGVCYFYAPRFYVATHPDAYEEALSRCDTAEAQFQDACAKGVGSVAMKYRMRDPLGVERLCLSHRPEQIPYCIEGMVSYYLVNFASPAKAAELCPMLQKENRVSCEKVVHQSEPFFGE